MFVTKCDICKKIIEKDKKSVMAGFGSLFTGFTFCESCGQPVIKFLSKHHLVKHPKKSKE